MRMAHYWETQEKRWYEQYLESEKMVSELETALINVEAIALTSWMMRFANPSSILLMLFGGAQENERCSNHS